MTEPPRNVRTLRLMNRLGEELTSERISVLGFGCGLHGKHPAEDPPDGVEALHGMADDGGHLADGGVDATVLGHNVRVQVLLVYRHPVDGAVHFAVHSLR